MAYRARVLSGEAAASGDIHLDVVVERQVDEETWTMIPLGHRTLVMNGAAVLAITEGPGTNAQKLAALAALFKQEILSWGLDESDDAYEQMFALIPGGWPVTVSL